MGRMFLFAALLLPAARAEAGLVTISEVLYDAAGTDDGKTFVELFGPPGLPLLGFALEGVNGAGGGITHRLDLGGATIPLDGFLVLADARKAGGTLVPRADLLFPNLDLQNGPDSVRLLRGSAVVDALGYGSFDPGLVFAGEGAPAPDAGPGTSLARRFADLDTDVNLADFEVLADPTPGWGRVLPAAAPVPEPGTWLLLSAGLVALAAGRRGRRGSRRQSAKQRTSPASVAT